MHYVIGDVHGHFDSLMKLVSALPDDATLMFVGDLIDRGKESAEVVRFVRENGHLCVMGNHETMMFTHGPSVVRSYESQELLQQYNLWYSNGGIDTVRSYNVVKIVDGKLDKAENCQEALQCFKSDMQWMRELPLYIELDVDHPSGKAVVVSHAPLTASWHLRDVESEFPAFLHAATTTRLNPTEDAPIFNIFGHTPRRHGPEVHGHFVNVDSGCYLCDPGYGKLSAYCVETGEVVQVDCCK
jgi:serine/threonine protein phosphatase 1